MSESELLTVREVARLCDRTEETVRRWIWSGRLPARKIGNQLFVSRLDLETSADQPRVAESQAPYTIKARPTRSGSRPLLKSPYDRDEALRNLEATVDFGKKLTAKYGHYNVIEALRRVREDA